MNRYENLSGRSGIRSYEITYEQMKLLAQSGTGLNSYISRVIKKSYAEKLV